MSIARFRVYLTGEAGVPDGELDAITAEVKQAIDDAITFAKQGPEPDPATAMDFIYA